VAKIPAGAFSDVETIQNTGKRKTRTIRLPTSVEP
jgi:hypothetical protein